MTNAGETISRRRFARVANVGVNDHESGGLALCVGVNDHDHAYADAGVNDHESRS